MKFESIETKQRIFQHLALLKLLKQGTFTCINDVPKDVCPQFRSSITFSGILFPGVSDKDSFAAWH